MHSNKYRYSLNKGFPGRKSFALAILFVVLICTGSTRSAAQEHFEVKFGTVRFHSEAPNEAISAYSNKLTGTIDLKRSTFSFKVLLNSFKGFNCPLLTYFFRANCMETSSYPDATFTGHILDEDDFTKDGEYYVRAKGKMKIHGTEQYSIVKVHVTARDGKLMIDTSLPIAFADYGIRIPKVFKNEVVKQVKVEVTATLVPTSSLSMR
jgi:hypothetical protein